MIKEIRANKTESITEIRRFRNLPKNKWKFLHKIGNIFVFESKK